MGESTNTKNLSVYIDEYGLPCQVEGDYSFGGGDTANRIGLIGVANALAKGIHTVGVEVDEEQGSAMVNSMLSKVEIIPGIMVRHPEPTKWWSEPRFFSRDQQSAVVIGAGFANNKALVKRLLVKHLKRFGLYQNFQINKTDVDGKKKLVQGDVATPEHFNFYLRALKLYPLYPLLLLGDLFTLFNSLIIIFKSFIDADDTSNDLNHIASLLQSKKVMPTPISWLARKVYVKFRRNAGPDDKNRLVGFGPQTALDWYFTDKTSSAPPINELFKSFLETELK